MNVKEFSKIYQVAKTAISYPHYTQEEATSALSGVALFHDNYKTDRRACTVIQAAWFLKYHCQYINGMWDMYEVSLFQKYYRKIDLLDLNMYNDVIEGEAYYNYLKELKICG